MHKVMGTDGSESIDGSVPLVALGLGGGLRRRRAGQFQRDRGALALTAGEPVHPGVGVVGEREFLQHTVDDQQPGGRGGVRR
ncbi:hypothetical protein, partial [Nocardia farcinica]|uniref:hypothetical protein n=1 Tax=Nocardia farcinica TaxID=37329 RepID=UPI002457CD10